MELATAIQLIENGIDKTSTPQQWADLGAGRGLFTYALSSLLAKHSIIHAIDEEGQSLMQIADTMSNATITKLNLDFTRQPISQNPLDGILMANSLHFVRNPLEVIISLKNHLKPTGRLIIVEYDLSSANRWVPYPVSYKTLMELASNAGFSSVNQLAETPSLYNRANIYSAVLI